MVQVAARLAGRTMGRILVVEDDAAVAAVVERAVLRRGTLDLASARSGGQALAALEANGFGVVVLDLRLPDLCGLEVLRRYRVALGGDARPGPTGESCWQAPSGACYGAMDTLRRTSKR